MDAKKISDAYKKEVDAERCKQCGHILSIIAVPFDPMARNTSTQTMVGACSVCGSRDYQNITVDQMQGCNHYGYFHTGIGKEGFSAIQNANWHDYYGINGLQRTDSYYGTGVPMPEYCTKYKQRISELESMLRELEYIGGDGCPICFNFPHSPDCRLNNLLKTVDKP